MVIDSGMGGEWEGGSPSVAPRSLASVLEGLVHLVAEGLIRRADLCLGHAQQADGEAQEEHPGARSVSCAGHHGLGLAWVLLRRRVCKMDAQNDCRERSLHLEGVLADD
jgi:hypothetical protein